MVQIHKIIIFFTTDMSHWKYESSMESIAKSSNADCVSNKILNKNDHFDQDYHTMT